MKKQHVYIYLMVSLALVITSIILFILDTSPIYYTWPITVFVLATLVAFVTLTFALLNKKELSDFAIEVVDWFRFISMSLMVVLMVFMFFISSATVFQNSMNPTLENGDSVLIYHYSYQPKRHDIVIVNIYTEHYPNHKGEADYYVKRVYGIPGDTVVFQFINVNTYLILINGEPVYNPEGKEYVAEINTSVSQMNNSMYDERDLIKEALDENNQIKEGRYLVFGDNEDNSIDSRDLGAIYKEDVVGKVIYRLSPFGGI